MSEVSLEMQLMIHKEIYVELEEKAINLLEENAILRKTNEELKERYATLEKAHEDLHGQLSIFQGDESWWKGKCL